MFYVIEDNASLLNCLAHTFFYEYQKDFWVNPNVFPNEKYDTLH